MLPTTEQSEEKQEFTIEAEVEKIKKEICEKNGKESEFEKTSCIFLYFFFNFLENS